VDHGSPHQDQVDIWVSAEEQPFRSNGSKNVAKKFYPANPSKVHGQHLGLGKWVDIRIEHPLRISSDRGGVEKKKKSKRVIVKRGTASKTLGWIMKMVKKEKDP